MHISETQEMYLVTIATLLEDGEESPISLSHIAKKLSVMPVSANEMVRKLNKEGLINYLPYKGVELLPSGLHHVRDILRRRRLWEVFFVEKLELSLEDADSLACRMEHITEPDVEERLDSFLGHPSTSPHGKAIPAPKENGKSATSIPLCEANVDAELEVLHLDCGKTSRDFLKTQGVKPGARIKVLAIAHQGPALLQCAERKVHISKDLVKHIFVNPGDQAPRNGKGAAPIKKAIATE